MAKKPLGEPRSARGSADYEFFDLLQSLVRRHGDPPLSALAKSTHRTRQVLHRALVGPVLPSQSLVEGVLDALECTTEEKSQVDSAFLLAHEQTIQARRGRAPQATGTTRTEQGRRDQSDGRYQAMMAEYLRQMRSDAGNPSLRVLEHETVRQGSQVSRSTLSSWFSGRSIPMNLDGLFAVSAALERLAGPRGTRNHRSREELARLRQMAMSERVHAGRGD
jgi:hypothetical protein